MPFTDIANTDNKPNDEEGVDWYTWFRSYYIYPETGQLLGFLGLAVAIFYKGGRELIPSGSALKDGIKNYSHIWVPAFVGLYNNSTNQYFNRLRENRDEYNKELKKQQELTFQRMLQCQERGEKAFQQEDFLQAYEQFKISTEIYSKIYHVQQRKDALNLYLSGIYKQVLSLYHLGRFRAAKQLLELELKNEYMETQKPLAIRLCNLRALILFQMASSPAGIGQENLLGDSLSHFITSYEADPSQSTVYFYIQYLKGNYRVLADNIPLEAFSPDILFDCDVERDPLAAEELLLLHAKACMQVGKPALAIAIFDRFLTSHPVRPHQLMRRFLVHLTSVQAYEMLKPSSTQDKIHLISIEYSKKSKNKSPSLELVERAVDLKSLELLRNKEGGKAKSCLDSALLLSQDKQELAFAHLQHGAAYLLLKNTLEQGASSTSATSAFEEEAIKHLDSVVSLLANMQDMESRALIEQAQNKLKTCAEWMENGGTSAFKR